MAWLADMQSHQGRHFAPPGFCVCLKIGHQIHIQIHLPPNPNPPSPRPLGASATTTLSGSSISTGRHHAHIQRKHIVVHHGGLFSCNVHIFT